MKAARKFDLFIWINDMDARIVQIDGGNAPHAAPADLPQLPQLALQPALYTT